ncbi:uncharacterized protein LOC127358307 [Dicentrarchus labrax]|uniref:uncharacterized protein LOC127358307 n=1 Tax=Dicentrarchus labrax TaxID=13489 RepID=UPI0021F51E87|nr:uncharacterized protein LOC127358307 [Dicentrarchus labrax]
MLPTHPNTPPQHTHQSPPPVPSPPNPYCTHPLVTSGRISVDLAHLLPEVRYNTGKVRRNTTKARILTAQEMSDAIEEAEDRAARRDAQAPAREQRRAENNGPTATSSTLPGGSRPSRRRTASPGAASASSSSLSIAGPSTRSAPSSASHGHRLPAPSGTSPPACLLLAGYWMSHQQLPSASEGPDYLPLPPNPGPLYCRINLSVPVLDRFLNGQDTRPDFRLSREALEVLLDLLHQEQRHGWGATIETLVIFVLAG